MDNIVNLIKKKKYYDELYDIPWELFLNSQIHNTHYNNIKIGTSIILNLKEDMGDFLEEDTIKKLVKKHSEFVSYPILLFTEKTREIEVEDDEEVEDDIKVEVEETNKEQIWCHPTS